MTWSIAYDDGEKASEMCHSCVRPYHPYTAGEKIDWRDAEADEIEFVPGVILGRVGKSKEEMYTIEVESIDEGTGKLTPLVISNVVPGDLRRRVSYQKVRQNTLEPGTRISALYQGGTKWYPGVIEGANADGTYDVYYDDDDVEKNVPLSSIRLV
jgi:SGF29 tudor-like domain